MLSKANTLHTYIIFIYFRREKALEGKSKVSHSVHCPYFSDDKQEFWWCYIADRKNHALITPPNHVTSLIDREEVELKFTAPQKPGTSLTLSQSVKMISKIFLFGLQNAFISNFLT